MIKQVYGVEGFNTDISFEACLRAKEFFNIDGLTVNASMLPFKDNQFDVVICSEVIEHLEFPLFALKELLRITKKYLLITTVEVEPFELERSIALKTRDLASNHAERNYYHPDDFLALFGKDTKVLGQHRILGSYSQNSVNSQDIKQMFKALVDDIEGYDFRYNGIIVLKAKDKHFDNNPKLSDDIILEKLLDIKVSEDHKAFNYNETINEILTPKLCCPVCKADDFTTNIHDITCKKCGEVYKMDRGILEMFRVEKQDENDLNEYFDKKVTKKLHKKLSPSNVIHNSLLIKILNSYKSRRLHSLRKRYIINFD